jgi:hypothetical protein
MMEMEYSDGGAMAQMLSQRTGKLTKCNSHAVLTDFAYKQYMHDHNNLHSYV